MCPAKDWKAIFAAVSQIIPRLFVYARCKLSSKKNFFSNLSLSLSLSLGLGLTGQHCAAPAAECNAVLACGNFQMPYTKYIYIYTSRPWRESGISEQLFSILSVARVVFHHLIYLWPQQFRFRSSWIRANALTIMRPSRFGFFFRIYMTSDEVYYLRLVILFNSIKKWR